MERLWVRLFGVYKMKWNYLFKIVFWNSDLDEHGAEDIDYCAIQAANAADAVKELEDYFGEDLIEFECRITEGLPIKLTEELYEKNWREV